MPMPIDIKVEMSDGSAILYTIPLNLMLGHKTNDLPISKFTALTAWDWVNPDYQIVLDRPINSIKSIQIDPTGRMVDLNDTDNKWVPK